jgi:hypothetical protein
MFRYFNLDVFGSKATPRAARTRSSTSIGWIPRARSCSSRRRRCRATAAWDLQLPAEAPLFEMLVDAGGRALMTAHGPAQVRGFNAGSHAATSRCSGCHLGHSTSP